MTRRDPLADSVNNARDTHAAHPPEDAPDADLHMPPMPDFDSARSSDVPPADSPATENASEEHDIPPMLREPTHIPRQPRAKFSPEQFYALSRVMRTDVDAEDEGLWLTEAECPKITPEGIHFGGTVFWDPAIQPLVDVGVSAPKRTFVIRYNKALYARGVLDEIIILEKLGERRYVERCRCRPPHLVSKVDLNRVLAERERFKKQLLAKIANAHGVRITLEQGDHALQQLRDEQARQARIQRRTKRAPVGAAPIEFKSAPEAERERQNEKVRDLKSRLDEQTSGAAGRAGSSGGDVDADESPSASRSTPAASAGAPAPDTPANPTPQSRARRGRRKKAQNDGPTVGAPRSDAPPAGAGHEPSESSTLPKGAAATPAPAAEACEEPKIADYLRAETGFLSTDDDD